MSNSSNETPISKRREPKCLSSEEQAVLQRHEDAKPKINTTLKIEGKNEVSSRHDDNLIGFLALKEKLGCQEAGFLETFIKQVANAASVGSDLQETETNFMLSVITGIEPRDQIEAMLGAQMAAIHMASMSFTRRLNHVETLDQQAGAEKALNKLMRTFTNQMEALRRYRHGGEQKVTVQHVQVNDGGQAVVGNVNHGKGGSPGG